MKRACGLRQRRSRSGSIRSWCHDSAITRPRQGPRRSSPGKTTGSPPGKTVVPRKARHTDLQRNIIDFCRLLRQREMLVTPSEVIDAIRTADAVDLSDRQEFKTALRSVLTAKPEDIPLHDASFDEFWRTRLPERAQEQGEEGVASEDAEAEGEEMPQPQMAEGDES